MPSMLYLDAARMDRMAPTAQLALGDFVRVAGEEGCTLYFEQLLKGGLAACPKSFQERFPGLRSWGGVAELRNAIARNLGLAPGAPITLAGRSTNLAKLAAKWLVRGGRRILVTDLTWPSYLKILQREARPSQGIIEFVRVRSAILGGKVSGDELVRFIVDQCAKKSCSGLFLPEVSHDGIRLPIPRICQAVRRAAPMSIVVDGSQAFGQIPVDLSDQPCDLYLAGCHKWLGSYFPLGIGACPNPQTYDEIRRICISSLKRGRLDDPLLAFLQSLDSDRPRRFSETVNLSPLFSCRGGLT